MHLGPELRYIKKVVVLTPAERRAAYFQNLASAWHQLHYAIEDFFGSFFVAPPKTKDTFIRVTPQDPDFEDAEFGVGVIQAGVFIEGPHN